MFQQNVQIKPFNGAMYKIVQNTAFVDVTWLSYFSWYFVCVAVIFSELCREFPFFHSIGVTVESLWNAYVLQAYSIFSPVIYI
jgi:hypothetical protein